MRDLRTFTVTLTVAQWAAIGAALDGIDPYPCEHSESLRDNPYAAHPDDGDHLGWCPWEIDDLWAGATAIGRAYAALGEPEPPTRELPASWEEEYQRARADRAESRR